MMVIKFVTNKLSQCQFGRQLFVTQKSGRKKVEKGRQRKCNQNYKSLWGNGVENCICYKIMKRLRNFGDKSIVNNISRNVVKDKILLIISYVELYCIINQLNDCSFCNLHGDLSDAKLDLLSLSYIGQQRAPIAWALTNCSQT